MWTNRVKTVLLLSSLSGLLLIIGYALGGTDGLAISFLLALCMNGITYFFSESIVLRLYKAQRLDHVRYNHLYQMVAVLAEDMSIPMPKLWIIASPMANAFATGRNPSHASIALTTGILSLLNDQELRGVLAHELSHIKNRDILISTIAATLATAIGYSASFLRHLAFRGNAQRQRGFLDQISLFLTALLMPLAATLIQLAISRSREYLADETGASHAHDPLALANALEKLHTHVAQAHLHPTDLNHASTAPLFIVHPFTSHAWANLFSTHPPMRDRIKRLRQMHEKMF
jgi:heat shock protein HtpX